MASNRELYNAIEERDRHISLIEQDLTTLEEENDKQQDELISYRDELANLQVLLKQTQIDNDSLVQERSQIQEQVQIDKRNKQGRWIQRRETGWKRQAG